LRLLAWRDLLPAHREGWPVLEAWSAKAVLPREPGEHCSSSDVVEVPQILGPWNDSEQKSREQDEYTASQGTHLKTPVHQRPARGGGLFHLLSLNLRLVTGFWIFRTQAPRTRCPTSTCYRASTAEYFDSRLPTLTKRCLPSSRSWRAVPIC
jgi:hypothetical protein